MGKKIDNLHRIVGDLESRYGRDDEDVQRLRGELTALVASKDAVTVNRIAPAPNGLNRQSQVKQHFHTTKSGDLLDVKFTEESAAHPPP
jgi:hypothetical protein